MAGASEPVADPITAERVALMGESANTLARLGSAVACDPDNRLGIVKRARSLDLSGQLPRSDVHQVIERLRLAHDMYGTTALLEGCARFIHEEFDIPFGG